MGDGEYLRKWKGMNWFEEEGKQIWQGYELIEMMLGKEFKS